jgi:hypothetical protein
MPTQPPAPPSSNPSSPDPKSPLPPALDLELSDWSHGGIPSAAENFHLGLQHASALLPSMLDQVLEGRNHLMNPKPFHL